MPLAAALEGPAKVSTLLIPLLTCSGIFSCQGYEGTDGRKYLLPIILLLLLLYYYCYYYYARLCDIATGTVSDASDTQNTKGSSSSVGSRTPRGKRELSRVSMAERDICAINIKRIKKEIRYKMSTGVMV